VEGLCSRAVLRRLYKINTPAWQLDDFSVFSLTRKPVTGVLIEAIHS